MKKGNRFETLVLHAFSMRTETVVEVPRVHRRPYSTQNGIDVTKNPVEVWI